MPYLQRTAQIPGWCHNYFCFFFVGLLTLRTMHDELLISSHKITPESNIKVRRIKQMITD